MWSLMTSFFHLTRCFQGHPWCLSYVYVTIVVPIFPLPPSPQHLEFLCSIPFYTWKMFHCMNIIPHFIGSFISGWTLGCIQFVGHYEWCCSESLCTRFCVDVYFHFPWVRTPRSGIAEAYGSSTCNFLRNCQTVSQGTYTVVSLPPGTACSCPSFILLFKHNMIPFVWIFRECPINHWGWAASGRRAETTRGKAQGTFWVGACSLCLGGSVFWVYLVYFCYMQLSKLIKLVKIWTFHYVSIMPHLKKKTYVVKKKKHRWRGEKKKTRNDLMTWLIWPTFPRTDRGPVPGKQGQV